MAKKKPKSAADKQHEATIKQLRTDLKSAEAKRDSWKQRATKAEASAAELRSQLKVTKKSLKKSRKPSAAEVPAVAAAGPDAEWTVVQLRAEARRRGLTGLSNKPKAELLAALA
ncbi:hypothetical protein [Angustibacter luteus]|uniref:Rho termination factor N-terminal domain-containing protein n=1 Tax=Angustibacter luteus TaxID=658456 RepID=A0ABW1JGZ8_9ACTN